MVGKLKLMRDQIWVLIAKDFKLKYNATAIGFLWCMLVPFFTTLIYYFVFGVMMRWNAKNYLLYLISGNFLWQFFANVISMNGHVLIANSALLKKTNFDRRLLVIGTFFTEGMHFILTIPILIGIMLYYHVTPQWWSILPNLAVCLVSLALISIGIGYFYAAANLWFRDLERIIGIFLMAWCFVSPVFIPVSNVPEKWQFIFKINPMALVLQIWRNIFYEPKFEPSLFLPPLIVGLVLFILGRAYFTHYDAKFAEMM